VTAGRSSLQGAHSQSTSVINVPSLQERHAPAHVGHDGVTLGDSLCGTKLAGQIKVKGCKHQWSRGCYYITAVSTVHFSLRGSVVAAHAYHGHTLSPLLA
jgi:hypothetical protein